jgi:hypothetical protein
MRFCKIQKVSRKEEKDEELREESAQNEKTTNSGGNC